MSKKKFKAGLESLFGEVGDDLLPGIRPLLVEEEAEKKAGNHRRVPSKKRSSKNFTSDIEDLFHNVLDRDQKETKEKTRRPKGRDTTMKKRNDRPVIGIDALIRQTSMDSTEGLGANTPLKKRITFTLEKYKLEQLKSIAKSKKSYLKDVVDDIISEYLNEYPDQRDNAN